MRTGTENISVMQQDLLRRCKRAPRPQNLIDAFQQLVRDDDIISEREEVHPGWLDVFDMHEDTLRRQLPSELFSRFDAFFAELRTYDPLFANLDPGKLSMTFVLGAGASKPEPSGIPTVRELLPQLLERARRLNREDVTQLADFCEERQLDNIEDLLTAAQLATFCSRSPSVLRLMNYLLYRSDTEPDEELWLPHDPYLRFRGRSVRSSGQGSADVSSVAFLQDTLQVLFGLLASTMLPARPNPAHKAIAAFAKVSGAGTSVVTTNYDCCIDLALGDAGLPFRYLIPFCNAENESSVADASPLIKLHGSLNWYYCETCQEVQLVDIQDMLKQYADDRAPYPVIGICKSCGGQRRGLLVPPLAMKFDIAPPLAPLTEKAKAAFDRADVIVVVGFSFAEADVYISRMISKSMQTRSDQKLVIVDPQSEVAARIRRRFKASIPNFDESRILRLTGDCSELLPGFLTGEIRDELKEASRKASPKSAKKHARGSRRGTQGAERTDATNG